MTADKKFIMDEGGKSLDDLLYPEKKIGENLPKIDSPAKALIAGAAVAGIAAVAISKVAKKDKED